MPGTTLYGGVIWGRKMCQVQLYMVVLFGEGRCSWYNSIWWCYLGREDVPETTVYGCVIREWKMYQIPLYDGVIGERSCIRTSLYGGVIADSPSWFCYLGRQDAPGTTLYGGVIWGGKMYQKFRTSLYGGVMGEGRFTRHNSV